MTYTESCVTGDWLQAHTIIEMFANPVVINFIKRLLSSPPVLKRLIPFDLRREFATGGCK